MKRLRGQKIPYVTLFVLYTAMPLFAMAQESEPGPTTVNPLSAIDPASLTGFRERPLFSPSRRLPEAELPTAPEAVEAPTETSDVLLLGIVTTPSGAIARVTDSSSNENQSIREGDLFRDWRVVSIGASEVTMERNGEAKTLTVFPPSGTSER